MWPWWQRLEHKRPWLFRACAATFFLVAGALVAAVLSQAKPWVTWSNVTLVVLEVPGDGDQLVLEMDYVLRKNCDRLRVTAPWSLVAYYADRDVAVSIPRVPSEEVISRAGSGHARVIITLDQVLDHGIRHELSIGLSCLQDRDGGTVHDADIAVVVKEFVPDVAHR